MSRCWMTSGKQSPAVMGQVSEARSGPEAAEKRALLGIGGESTWLRVLAARRRGDKEHRTRH